MADIINSQIGKWLASQRKARGFSQQYVADKMGTTKTAVHYWESGKRTIYAVHFINYCRAIGADPVALTHALTRMLYGTDENGPAVDQTAEPIPTDKKEK